MNEELRIATLMHANSNKWFDTNPNPYPDEGETRDFADMPSHYRDRLLFVARALIADRDKSDAPTVIVGN